MVGAPGPAMKNQTVLQRINDDGWRVISDIGLELGMRTEHTYTIDPDDPLSAGEVGEAVGISRVTSRRYLEHLTRRGDVTRQPRYGTPGRPETEYRWAR